MNSNHTFHGPRQRDIVLAYTLLRIIVGINYFNHGFTRLGNLPGFMDSMVSAMKAAWMPEFLVRINAALVPPTELIIGVLLILGLFTRGALIAALILMTILMYGVTIVQNWDTAGSQLVYDLILAILLASVGYNRISLDQMIFGKKEESSVPSEKRPVGGVMRFVRRIVKRPRRGYHSASRL
jgi:thiosulfate dehydrogenase [quinone] large subunit